MNYLIIKICTFINKNNLIIQQKSQDCKIILGCNFGYF